MAKRPFDSIRRLLNRPMFGTTVIPPDARVDPASFPQDEFPVYCLGCDYELRGLPEPRCPECGKEFDRGRLLVDQYARPEGLNRRRYAQRWRVANWAIIVAVSAMVLLIVFGGLLRGYLWIWPWPKLPAPVQLDYLRYGIGIALVLMVIAALLSLPSDIAELRAFLKYGRYKRRAILRALEDRPNEHDPI